MLQKDTHQHIDNYHYVSAVSFLKEYPTLPNYHPMKKCANQPMFFQQGKTAETDC